MNAESIFKIGSMNYEIREVKLSYLVLCFVLCYTLLFFGGRHPLCGKGVTSLIIGISMPD